MKTINVECTSNDKVVNGLLTYGKIYKCIASNNYKDIKLVSDDQNNSRWFKEEFFKYNYKELREVEYIDFGV
jgi:hypothetical protein